MLLLCCSNNLLVQYSTLTCREEEIVLPAPQLLFNDTLEAPFHLVQVLTSKQTISKRFGDAGPACPIIEAWLMNIMILYISNRTAVVLLSIEFLVL